MALADAVRRLARSLRLTMTVAHVHHGLRGADADADASFVASVAHRWKVPCVSARVRTGAYRRRHRMGMEEAARRLRYRSLERLRRQVRADLILTAHHADDQAETVFLRATRGSHVRGLAGILPVLDRPPVARPLLEVARTEIERYVKHHRLSYRDDDTNEDLSLRRNLIRHRLLERVGHRLGTDATVALPRLAAAARNLGASAESLLLRLEHMTLRSARSVHFLRGEAFERWPSEVQNELLARLLRRAALEPTDPGLKAVRSLLALPVGRWRPVGGDGWRAFRERDGLSLIRYPELPKAPVVLLPGRSALVPGGRVRIGRPRSAPRSAKGPSERVWVDINGLKGRLTARLWRTSDRFCPLGMASERKVSDLLTDRKVPAYRKRLIPVLLSGRRIIWVCGVALDDRVKIVPATKQALQFSFHSNV